MPPTAPGANVFADRAALLAARDAWCADPTAAALTYGPIGLWDVSNVTDLSFVFCGYYESTYDCNAACSTFNDDVSAWNVSRVKSLQGTFYDASDFNQPLNTWHTSLVTNMQARHSDSLIPRDSLRPLSPLFPCALCVPIPPPSASPSPPQSTFYGADSFDQPLDAWDVSRVTKMAV